MYIEQHHDSVSFTIDVINFTDGKLYDHHHHSCITRDKTYYVDDLSSGIYINFFVKYKYPDLYSVYTD